MIEDFRYETATAQLAPGETVLLVTDGVTEGVDRRGDLFGTPRVTALAASAARTPAHSEPARLVADLVTGPHVPRTRRAGRRRDAPGRPVARARSAAEPTDGEVTAP